MKRRAQRRASRWAVSAVGLASTFLFLGLAQPVGAEDVPVTYLVSRSEFKDATNGESLTFEIHEDPACSAAVDSEVVTVGDPALLIESVTRRIVKRAPAADGQPVRLRFVMTPTTASGRLYARVTGVDVVPFVTECQAQSASMSEPDSLESLTCADGEVAKWNAVSVAWECAADDDTLGALACATTSQGIAGAGSPFSATASCPVDTLLTGGGHSGIAAGDTLLSSQPDGANGWFCEVDGAAAAGSCYARCCAIE